MSDKKYNLRLYPDYVLRGAALAVDDVNGSVRDLMTGMSEIMYEYQGIGLAAPQVGVLQRVIIADVGEGLVSIANPEILQREDENRKDEGCLSLPDIQVEINRSVKILIQGIDADGREIKEEFSDMTARVIQHEIDHLNGVLIIDYASPTEKILLNKQLRTLKKKKREYEKHCAIKP